MDKPDLQTLLAKWRAVLRLEDWDIEIMYVKPHELDPNTGGQVVRCGTNDTARIKVLEPECYDPCLIVKQDPEYTVIHELVHLHFSVIDEFKEGAETAMYERAVRRLAMALLAMDRKSQTK